MIRLLAILAVTLTPTLAIAQDCSGSTTASSCPEGHVWNSETHSCVQPST